MYWSTTPSVRNTYSRGAGRDEFNIRGFTLFNYDVVQRACTACRRATPVR